MTRKGKVLSCTNENYSYTPQGTTKTMHRHLVIIQLPDSTTISGKYDSPKLPQESFIVGQDVDFETEEKTMKNGQTYLKFKKAQKEREGYTESPETLDRIARSVAFFCAIECHRNGLGKDQSIKELTGLIFAWIHNAIEKAGGGRQMAIAIEGVVKLMATNATQLEITNMDYFWKATDSAVNYVLNG